METPELVRIYYGDGSTFEGLPEDAPIHNVQCIAYDDPDTRYGRNGRIVMSGWDLYIYTDNVMGWVGTNKYTDLLMHLEDGLGRGGVRAVLRGRWIGRGKFREIQEQAHKDPLFSETRLGDPAIEDGIE
jgi:hypothetical protein